MWTSLAATEYNTVVVYNYYYRRLKKNIVTCRRRNRFNNKNRQYNILYYIEWPWRHFIFSTVSLSEFYDFCFCFFFFCFKPLRTRNIILLLSKIVTYGQSEIKTIPIMFTAIFVLQLNIIIIILCYCSCRQLWWCYTSTQHDKILSSTYFKQ